MNGSQDTIDCGFTGSAEQTTEDLNTYTEISNMFSITNSKGSEYSEI